MSKRYDVMSPRPKKDGGTYWHRVGLAFEGEKGISIEFNSLPIADKDGRVRVSLFEARERQQSDQRQPERASSLKDDMSDEIPF